MIFDATLIEEREYWLRQLGRERGTSAPPADGERKGAGAASRNTLSIELPLDVAQAARRLAGGSAFLLYAALASGIKACLYRYAGGESVAIGSPALAEAGKTNALVILDEMNARTSFKQLLLGVRETLLEAYARQQYPFANLVRDLGLEQAEDRCPLFDVAVLLKGLHGDLPEVRNDLTITFEDDTRAISASIAFNSRLYTRERIELFVNHFINVFRDALENKERSLDELSMMSEEERRRVLVEWSRTPAASDEDDTSSAAPFVAAHRLFEQWAAETPHALAISCGERRLTYAELNAAANRLARQLLKRGVGADVRVALCLDRSPDMIVSLLAVLKAGGTYLPLDPSYPLDRLSFMLEDSQAAVLVTRGELADELPSFWGQVIDLDEEAEEIETQDEEDIAGEMSGEDGAYVIYTSGSTGRPKGVLVTQAGLSNLLRAQRRVYEVGPRERILQFASPSFDASVAEVTLALCTGASLWLASREELLPGPGLVELLTRCKITNVTLPPSALGAMPDVELPELRTLIVAGEACPTEAVQQWAGGRRFFNAYGPTEATVWATVKECVPTHDEAQPSIGRPIVNSEVYILDGQLQPVPVGVAGELCLGGAGLARGYLNRPELTAERFIPHPYSSRRGARLYRTGDVARFRADGEIEFLGRADEQVKVRGFRIELGEIESALREHVHVDECVVMARATDGAQRLVGYVVAEDGARPTTSELIAHLKTRLPEYMLPSAFVMLDEIPLTPNGKVDRRALPAPDASRPELKETFAAPGTHAEETLARIWADVLGLERVGIHDNFFELGGDSILSIQIIARASQAGLQLSPKQMFQHQTVEELAAVAGTAVVAVAEQGIVTGDVLLTPIQRWFFEQELAEPHHYNQSLLLKVRQSLDASLLREVVRSVIEHHDALRLRFVREERGWRQFNAAPDEDVPFTTHDLSKFAIDEQETRLAEMIDELQASLDLTNGPLLRVAFFDFGPERAARLFIAVHHLATDGVSWRILLEDLQLAYRQASEGEEISLPAKTTSFKEWAEKLQAYATGEEIQGELGYWLEEPRREVSMLPVDYPAAGRQPSLETARAVRVSLSPEETRALLKDVPAAYNTQVNDVLLTALAQSLTGWADERRLLVALEGHGREEIEGAEADLSRTVGWFTSLFPALLDLGETSTPGEALKAIKEQLRAVPNRGIGYGVLRYLSGTTTAEALAALPHAEVSFNYLGQFDQTLDESSPFEPAPESSGHGHSLRGTRPHLLEINGSVSGGRLQLSWTYSENVHRETTIRGLAEDFIAALRTLIAHCTSDEAGGYTPSDFPLAGLSQQEVDHLAETYTDIEDVYPLSPLQQGLLFHTLLEEGTGVYFTQLVCQIPGDLNVAVFKRVWTRVQERHAILRTAFAWAGLPAQMQVVLSHAELPWDEQDWRGVPVAEQEMRLSAYLETNQRRGFDLTRAPLMRCTLIRRDDDTYQFIWSLHHLLLDGWALFRVIKEVFSLYEMFQQGEELQLEQPRPYRDFIAWLQRQKLSDEAFWRQALKGFTAPTPLSVDRPAQPTAAAATAEDEHRDQRLKLSAETTAALQELVKRQQLTLNTAVQGAWALLLSRYSGESDVVFGATASGRPATLDGVESMVGPFINTLPVRAQIEAGATLLPWLKEIQAQQIEARQYEYSPLVRVQSWSEVPRGQSLFESVLIFENFPIDESLRRSGGAGGLQVRRVNAIEKMNYPLALVVMPGHELSFRIAYHNSRFDDATITRMLGHLRHLLEQMTAHPERSLASYGLLTEPELRQLTVEWNETNDRTSANGGIGAAAPFVAAHRQFEQWAASSPDAMAVAFGERRLTYAELNAAANRLAHHLQQRGIGPDVRVALCLTRSTEMIVALLAVLKAGGTYLPLDPSYPLDRLSFMLEDSQAAVLLTSAGAADELPSFWGQVIDLDEEAEEIEAQGDGDIEGEISGGAGAYVIYTSGSTGRPKGVVVTHAGLCNLTRAQRQTFDPQPSDRVLQFASLSFDASIFEIVMALCTGASLWLASREELMPGPGLVELLERCRITNATLTPSALGAMPDAELPSLRTLIVAGEPCPAEAVARWGGTRRFFNAYGPTEATVWATVKECVAGEEQPTIGRTVVNAQAYILDRQWQPVPVGVAGELYLGGAGLARGYLNRPDLTAERFIPHPFATEPGARLYRTGDVARFLPDGEMEFLGRSDEQVKVRGFRIELGEVESALREHAQVGECVVVARATDGVQQLVGYVVVDGETAPTTSELRSFLQERLPDYMIPGVFVMLAALPLTPNGKVDRKALPSPDESRPELAEQFVAPRTSVEETLAHIWVEVLRVERVGIDDNYFALGGDSIRSVQILSKAQERGLNLTLPQLFQHQTIRHLAQELSTVEAEAVIAPQGTPFGLISEEDRALLPLGVEDAYPLTMVQAGMLFHSEFNPDTAIYHSINTFHLRAPFQADALREAVERVAARHPVLRTSFDMNTFSEPLQLVHHSAHVPVQEFDLRALAPGELEVTLEEWLEAEKVRHFDWSCAPLLRLDVHRRTEETFQLTFTAHHAIIDGWSDGLFLTELFSLYLSLLKEEEPTIEPPPAATFSQYVALEREALESNECQQFWLRKMEDAAAARLPRMATASPANLDEATEFTRVEVPVSPETSEGLKRLAQEAGVPLKSVLLAAHLRVMGLLGGQAEALTGVVWNGRPETTDGERIIGLFLNTLPFRLSLPGGTWLDLARSTFHAEREALPFRRYPLGQLQRSLGGQALFETCFNFTHMHVYQSLQGFREVEVLSGRGVAETNFALMANFNVSVGSSRVMLVLDCNASELGDELIASITRYYAKALAAMASDGYGRYELCDLLATDERRQLLEDYNDTSRDYPADLTIAEMFERQAARTPERVALTFEGARVTYGELNRRANRLAHYLRGLGTGQDTLVGIMAERSIEMVVALMGVLKAGGAYLPLDPDYPRERIAFMLDDARPTVILTQRHLADSITYDAGRVICLDTGTVELVAQSDLNPAHIAQGENLAYVIYTSGSTGKPKGVAITHRSLSNFLHSMRREPGLSSTDTLVAVTSLSFDIAGLELYLPLMCGARLVLASREEASDAGRLQQLLESSGASVMQATPATWRMLADAGWEPVRPIKALCGGEALPAGLAQELCRRTSQAWNLYGPTETTIWSACERIATPRERVTIGHPIDNTSLYVLDAGLRPVPFGVPGELYIGGDGLARGYLNRPDLTAERFIPDPFSTEPGARLYRTGDVARFLPGVGVEFLGRADEQVKVRGFRIELGEVELALVAQEGVRQCVAVAQEGAGGEKHLVAYVVAAEGAGELRSGELRASLRERLPDYMVPSSIVVLDELPLTPNGKVDRKALRGMKWTGEARELEPLETPTEEILAELWSGVLGIERIGANDNFFELGGHSLAATRLITRVRAAFGVDLSLRTLFVSPTVRGLAEVIEEAALEQSSAANIDELLSKLENLGDDEMPEIPALDNH